MIFVVLLLSTGCQMLRPGSVGSGVLPDYPKAATTLTPGQVATYKNIKISVVDIIREESAARVRFTLQRGRETTNFDVEMGELTVSGDLLVQFQARESAVEGEADLAVASLFWLPDLMRSNSPRTRRDLLETRPGEIAFFQDGFAAIRAIAENDYVETNDDSVLLSVWTPEDALEDVTLREFSAFPIGKYLLQVGNVYGGETPGAGRVELTLAPLESAWDDTVAREELVIPYRGSMDWKGHQLKAEPLPGGWRSRILLGVTRGESQYDVVLTEGQAWRHGNVAWRFDGMTGSAANLTGFELDRSVFPADVRDITAAGPDKAQNPRAPTEIERKLSQDQSVEFWGARIRLARVLEVSPTDLFDDVAELVFDRDGLLEVVRVREGDRATVRGSNRWWVVEVKEATPGGRNSNGSAEVILSTGTFFNP
jgi:hypothetical protein